MGGWVGKRGEGGERYTHHGHEELAELGVRVGDPFEDGREQVPAPGHGAALLLLLLLHPLLLLLLLLLVLLEEEARVRTRPLVEGGGEADHPGLERVSLLVLALGRGLQVRQEGAGNRKMPQVIHPEHQIVALGGATGVEAGHPRVQHQVVDAAPKLACLGRGVGGLGGEMVG